MNERVEWSGHPMHVIWGWMQVDEVASVDTVVRRDLTGAWAWAAGHPHLAHYPNRNNTLYVAARELSIPGSEALSLPGAGTFDQFNPRLQLTAEGQSPSRWSVPRWLLPDNRRPLSYHGRNDRWTTAGDEVHLKTVGRGQEFVLDATEYPEAGPWIIDLIGDLRA